MSSRALSPTARLAILWQRGVAHQIPQALASPRLTSTPNTSRRFASFLPSIKCQFLTLQRAGPCVVARPCRSLPAAAGRLFRPCQRLSRLSALRTSTKLSSRSQCISSMRLTMAICLTEIGISRFHLPILRFLAIHVGISASDLSRRPLRVKRCCSPRRRTPAKRCANSATAAYQGTAPSSARRATRLARSLLSSKALQRLLASRALSAGTSRFVRLARLSPSRRLRTTHSLKLTCRRFPAFGRERRSWDCRRRCVGEPPASSRLVSSPS